MHRLDRRLKKLEARVEIDVGPSWGDYYARASRLSESTLSSDDRSILSEVFALKRGGGQRALTAAHESVWERWNVAFDKAAEELHIPFSMYASDAWL